MKLAVVGSAGRRNDQDRLDLTVYKSMVEKAITVIEVLVSEHDLFVDCLVSGGAAWADHVAVTLFSRHYVNRLELHLPCSLNQQSAGFDVTGFISAGSTINHYHRLFSKKLNIDSLCQLRAAINTDGCSVSVHPGFKTRNTAVAENSDALLAMTFGNGRIVKPGGTEDTVRKFLEREKHGPAYHMDLNTLLCYRHARVA